MYTYVCVHTQRDAGHEEQLLCCVEGLAELVMTAILQPWDLAWLAHALVLLRTTYRLHCSSFLVETIGKV